MSEARRRLGRPSLPAAAAACLVLVVSGCGDDGDGSSGSGSGEAPAAENAVKVNIASFKFIPKKVRVKAGGTIEFVNQDEAPHTAQTGSEAAPGPEGGFDTGRLDLGQKSKLTLEQAGTFDYYCLYHRFMVGTVEVVE